MAFRRLNRAIARSTGWSFDLFATFEIAYCTSDENIAGNGSVSCAHTGLLNSRGHRANGLNKASTHVGIGVPDGGPYGKNPGYTTLKVVQPGFPLRKGRFVG